MATLAEMLADANAALAATPHGQQRLGQYWLGYVLSLDEAQTWVDAEDVFTTFQTAADRLALTQPGNVRYEWYWRGALASAAEARLASDAPVVTWVEVPYTYNMPQAEAESELTTAGFVVGTVTTGSDAIVDAGSVIRTYPEGGTEAPDGWSVDLFVSTGP